MISTSATMKITVLLCMAAVITLSASQTTQPAMEPASCPLEVQIAFTHTLPNAMVCAPSIGAVFTPVRGMLNNSLSSALIENLDNVCIESCGGQYVNFLTSESCNDTFGALTLEVFCTATNGAAAIGPYCRFASGDLDQTIFNALIDCDNTTTCAPRCRDSLLKLKSQIGCCYQNLYNNTEYLAGLFMRQLLPQFAFNRLQLLNNPLANAWDACNVTAPQECTAEPFGCSTCRMNSTCQSECPTPPPEETTPPPETSSSSVVQLYSAVMCTMFLLAAIIFL